MRLSLEKKKKLWPVCLSPFILPLKKIKLFHSVLLPFILSIPMLSGFVFPLRNFVFKCNFPLISIFVHLHFPLGTSLKASEQKKSNDIHLYKNTFSFDPYTHKYIQ